MSVQNIINGAVAVQKTIPGIKMAYADAQGSFNQLPCFMNYPGTGQLEWPRSTNIRTIEHSINMDLYIEKGGDIQAADRICKPFIDTVIATFDQSIQLGGSCFNSGVISYSYGMIEYAGTQYIGIKFILKAIEKSQVIYKA